MAPVEHTCPDIKKATEEIEDICNNLLCYRHILEDINPMVTKLKGVQDTLDDLRKSNEALRGWGYELELKNKKLTENK